MRKQKPSLNGRKIRSLVITATVELTIDMDTPKEILMDLVAEGEIDMKDIEIAGVEGDVVELKDDPKQLVGEFMKIKSGTFENRLCGYVTGIQSVVVETRNEDDDATA